eukprot:4394274-Pyramimonas_sp.AAC.1
MSSQRRRLSFSATPRVTSLFSRVSSERWLKSSAVPNVDEMHSEFANSRVSGLPLSLGKSRVVQQLALQGLHTFGSFNANGGRQTLKTKPLDPRHMWGCCKRLGTTAIRLKPYIRGPLLGGRGKMMALPGIPTKRHHVARSCDPGPQRFWAPSAS